MTHTTRIAVAMGTALLLDNRVNAEALQHAYERALGGGCVEIYQDIADYAMIAGALLDAMDALQDADPTLSYPGVFDYEVAEPFVAYWQNEIKLAAKDLDDGDEAVLPDFNLHLGDLAHQFFIGKRTNDQLAAQIEQIITKYTGYVKEPA